jgi:hypothetical protein
VGPSFSLQNRTSPCKSVIRNHTSLTPPPPFPSNNYFIPRLCMSSHLTVYYIRILLHSFPVFLSFLSLHEIFSPSPSPLPPSPLSTALTNTFFDPDFHTPFHLQPLSYGYLASRHSVSPPSQRSEHSAPITPPPSLPTYFFTCLNPILEIHVTFLHSSSSFLFDPYIARWRLTSRSSMALRIPLTLKIPAP